jgi:hypothetical protein
MNVKAPILGAVIAESSYPNIYANAAALVLIVLVVVVMVLLPKNTVALLVLMSNQN